MGQNVTFDGVFLKGLKILLRDGFCIPTPNLYDEALTPSTSECTYIWR